MVYQICISFHMLLNFVPCFIQIYFYLTYAFYKNIKLSINNFWIFGLPFYQYELTTTIQHAFQFIQINIFSYCYNANHSRLHDTGLEYTKPCPLVLSILIFYASLYLFFLFEFFFLFNGHGYWQKTYWAHCLAK